MLSALTLAYVPAMTSILVVASKETIQPHVNYLLWAWRLSLVSFGPPLNPVIYCWSSKKLRHAVLEVVRLTQQKTYF